MVSVNDGRSIDSIKPHGPSNFTKSERSLGKCSAFSFKGCVTFVGIVSLSVCSS